MKGEEESPMPLELLAPAKNVEIARQAILHGADAVYIGGPAFGARAAASNDMAEIAKLARWAHSFGVKIYLTLNTIIYDHEIAKVEAILEEAEQAGVDAVIIQDMGILRMNHNKLDVHASTQCDIRTPEKARFLAECGFSQLVFPRELSLDEIRAMRNAVPTDVKLEAFVHGALCVSYSGDCQASCVANGRSANRGECAQMCRMSYDVVDAEGKVLLKDKHVLSLRDLCRLDHLEDLALAGISSFKIEGRLKDADYVKNVVAAYRKEIDRIIAKYPDKFCKASYGKCQIGFTADVNKTFNRGYTRYFIDGRPKNGLSMANLDTPKWIGEEVGKAIRQEGNVIIAKLSSPLANGDGMGYYDKNGKFCGFRLNRVEGNRLFPASEVAIPAGASLYRNQDTRHMTLMAKGTSSRTVDVDMRLYRSSSGIELEIIMQNKVGRATIECVIDCAKTPQKEQRQRVLSKLGDTIYALRKLDDQLDDMDFIPASVLTQLRRDAVSNLEECEYVRAERRPEDKNAKWPEGRALTYHQNVSNRLAQQFYHDHGVETIQPALECDKDRRQAHVVMTTRYCLRRELGACLKEGGAKRIPQPIFIQNRAARYQLQFDCDKCQMQVRIPKL